MSQVNPFVAAILPSAQTQRQQATDRNNQIRRQQELQKNVAQHGSDTFEHQVESTDAVSDVHDEDAHSDPRQKSHNSRSEDDSTQQPPAGSDDEPRLDLTA